MGPLLSTKVTGMGSGPKAAAKTCGLDKNSFQEALQLCDKIQRHCDSFFNMHDLVVFLCLTAKLLKKALQSDVQRRTKKNKKKKNKQNTAKQPSKVHANIQKVGKSWQVRVWDGSTTKYVASFAKLSTAKDEVFGVQAPPERAFRVPGVSQEAPKEVQNLSNSSNSTK